MPPDSLLTPGRNRPTAVSAPQKTRPSLPTAVPPHSLPTPGPNRLTAVPPPQKHGRHCRRPCPHIHSLRQAQPG
ncbi:MAG: hypothetical protein HS099_05105 [Ardenticatenaceae bacterium]|nr:hypothetical protein [Ardenticatenaceae bacterium]